MADKLKVLFFYIVYPLAMGTYFRRALSRRQDIDLRVVGPYSGAYIPWLGGMNVPVKYAIPPDIPLPFPPMGHTVNYSMVKAQLGDWKPDLVLTADAGIHWNEKPTDGMVAHIATDPHVLDYSLPRSYSDKFFNMQKVYSSPGDIWLPYAYDPTVWYPDEYTVSIGQDAAVPVKTYDAALVGMPYPQRIEWVEALRRKGLRVAFENGPIFDEARDLYSKARIGLNWSSLNDLNARVFELMAMGLAPVLNRVPDLPELFQENKHYMGFSSMAEAIGAVTVLRDNPGLAAKMGEEARDAVQPHTYDARIGQILEECGF